MLESLILDLQGIRMIKYFLAFTTVPRIDKRANRRQRAPNPKPSALNSKPYQKAKRATTRSLRA